MTQAPREFKLRPLTLRRFPRHPVHGDLLDPAPRPLWGISSWPAGDRGIDCPSYCRLMARVA